MRSISIVVVNDGLTANFRTLHKASCAARGWKNPESRPPQIGRKPHRAAHNNTRDVLSTKFISRFGLSQPRLMGLAWFCILFALASVKLLRRNIWEKGKLTTYASASTIP